jgi:hypothetical protein
MHLHFPGCENETYYENKSFVKEIEDLNPEISVVLKDIAMHKREKDHAII